MSIFQPFLNKSLRLLLVFLALCNVHVNVLQFINFIVVSPEQLLSIYIVHVTINTRSIRHQIRQ